MAWNDSGNGKDPWKKRGTDEQPNDLDRIVQGWQKRLGALLGGGDSGGARTGRRGSGGSSGFLLVLFALLAWGLTGFYRVDEAERGVVQRFGEYTKTTLPGLHWHLPIPIESVDVVNTTIVTTYDYRTEMLTADEQYVFIDMVVQYRRENPEQFLFEVEDPEITLQDVTESALREVVGTSELETLVTGRREEIASRTLTVLQRTLDGYESGINVTSISLRNVNYPAGVQQAVDDAQKARNDSERYELEADRYSRDIIPRARGEAARILEDANAYRDRKVADAEGDAARFLALLTEYEKAPRVTRDRLYIEAVEEVYGNSNKVILDSEGSGNLMYLPLDRLLESAGSSGTRRSNPASGSFGENNSDTAEETSTSDARERRTRQ